MTAKPHRIMLSCFTNPHGAFVYQAHFDGMPVQRETPSYPIAASLAESMREDYPGAVCSTWNGETATEIIVTSF